MPRFIFGKFAVSALFVLEDSMVDKKRSNIARFSYLCYSPTCFSAGFKGFDIKILATAMSHGLL